MSIVPLTSKADTFGISGYITFGMEDPVATDPTKVGALRPYQQQGARFLAEHASALLADEMGLGKTVQTAVALQVVLRLPDCNRSLIVCPSALTLNWERELAVWAPDLAVRRLRGPAEERAALYQLPVPVLVASYEQLRRDAINLKSDLRFGVVVLDEAQRIKNRDSATALACRMLRRDRSWALTGTPIENEVADVLSVFRFLAPGLLGDGASKQEIQGQVEPYFLRRRKAEVLTELPPIIVQDLPLELTAAQRNAYDAVWASRLGTTRSGGYDDAALLAILTRLKQICNYDRNSGQSSKLETLILLLEGLSGTADKVLVFSQYVQTLRWLSEHLGVFPHGLYHGEMSTTQREQALTSFQEDPGPRALLVSLRAGGVGLNIPAASLVVLFDRWWNPAAEQQAINRAHRFGRERALHVVRFSVVDTIEERIAEILEDKQDIFDDYIEAIGRPAYRTSKVNILRRILGVEELTSG